MANHIPREWLHTRLNGQIPETVTALDLMAAELPPVRWVVPGVLSEGVPLLAGKPKLGKSWLALGKCLAVAAGGVALGTRQVERGDVLYLALEDNRRRLQKRLSKMLCGPAPNRLEIATAWPKLDEGGVEADSPAHEGPERLPIGTRIKTQTAAPRGIRVKTGTATSIPVSTMNVAAKTNTPCPNGTPFCNFDCPHSVPKVIAGVDASRIGEGHRAPLVKPSTFLEAYRC